MRNSKLPCGNRLGRIRDNESEIRNDVNGKKKP